MNRNTMRWIVAASLALSCVGTATAVDVNSQVGSIRIAAADRLPAPRSPQSFEDGDFCANMRIQPVTAAGKHAASLGWYVTSEVEEAGYTAVGIFSRGGSATSGTCLISDGNVVLYRDGTPAAIVYEPPHPENESGLVGGVGETLTNGRVRISDWTPPGFVHGDIELRPDSITVVPVAAMETACGGIGLPNIRGKTVPEARKLLAPHGWKPKDFSDGEQDNPHDSATSLRAEGLSEFETCSGTGYGFCAVGYLHDSGASLNVTTVGEEYRVSSYDARCVTGTDRASEGIEESSD